MQQAPPPHLTSRRQRKLWEQQQRDNAAKRQKKDNYENQTPFRHAERHFKHAPQIDLAQAIDFDSAVDHARITRVPLHTPLAESLFGKTTEAAYTLKGCRGLIYIPNPFSPAKQRHYVKQCLATYARPPNRSNLDAHYQMPAQGLWALYADEQRPNASSSPTAVAAVDKNEAPMLPSAIMHKLRWITLGCQYDWTTKKYREGEAFPVPDDLAALTAAIVAAVQDVGDDGDDGRGCWRNTYQSDQFKAEAGVINYYQLKDTLMGHVDQSERNMDAPLVSLSFGHACIYLLGGPTRETPPTAIHLKSGDILIMTGECRKAYHGVPRILQDTLPEYLSTQVPEEEDPDWAMYGAYMSTSRINLNIRQVE